MTNKLYYMCLASFETYGTFREFDKAERAMGLDKPLFIINASDSKRILFNLKVIFFVYFLNIKNLGS